MTHALKKGQWDYIDASVLDPYPALVKHYDTVLAHPLVVEHAVYL